MPDVARGASGRTADSWDLLYRAAAEGEPLSGYYHRNYRVGLPPELADAVSLPAGTPVKVRAPIPEAVQFNLRIWPEGELLRAIAGRVDGSPRVLADRPGFTVHSFAQGVPLSGRGGAGLRQGRGYAAQLETLFRQTAAVPFDALPPLPGGWPADGDCAGFLRTLVDFTESEVKGRSSRAHQELFAALGVADGALGRLRERAAGLSERPFTLLHTDAHAGNLIVGPGQELSLIDWELALYGDPVYEIAAHLGRMRYATGGRRRSALRAWRSAVAVSCPGALSGHRGALRVYLDFERLLSVYIDVIRLTLALPHRAGPAELTATAERILVLLAAARGPLGLRRVPDTERIAAACAVWQRNEREVPRMWNGTAETGVLTYGQQRSQKDPQKDPRREPQRSPRRKRNVVEEPQKWFDAVRTAKGPDLGSLSE
ncbi:MULTISPECIES: phosphotransferase [unclassified Streptomyces]|uniref:phosphotransferase n=1 Tax=unclassified Streptomyces TaxID=2593676 RepID=UPI002E1599ED|nr:aminoglycoside phosphotransferase family protein [Streptomyces sp. NBC_01197]WSS50123.1 aminoglycoside phosphotransferase family protein [Streptomyces sp. NBC_01180]